MFQEDIGTIWLKRRELNDMAVFITVSIYPRKPLVFDNQEF